MQLLTDSTQKNNKLTQILTALKQDFNLTPYIGIEIEFYLINIKNVTLLEQYIGYQLTSEQGKNQYEISFPPADQIITYLQEIQTTKLKIRQAAALQDGKVDFSSKPYKNDYGSALHVHLNFPELDCLEKLAQILCHYLPKNLPIFLPNKSDYARLDARFMAPTHICYGGNNRSVAIRIISQPHRRLEHRVAAAEADPILVVFAILESIYDGLKYPHSIKKFQKIYGNASDTQYNLTKITADLT